MWVWIWVRIDSMWMHSEEIQNNNYLFLCFIFSILFYSMLSTFLLCHFCWFLFLFFHFSFFTFGYFVSILFGFVLFFFFISSFSIFTCTVHALTKWWRCFSTLTSDCCTSSMAKWNQFARRRWVHTQHSHIHIHTGNPQYFVEFCLCLISYRISITQCSSLHFTHHVLF